MEIITITLIFVVALFALIIGFLFSFLILKNRFEKKLDAILKAERLDAIKRSRAVIGGQFSEQLSPYLPGFPYKPTETKFLGKPVDLIVFKGADDKNITEVIFIEVKSNNSKLNKQEKNLKETILAKKIRWDEYKIPKNLTK